MPPLALWAALLVGAATWLAFTPPDEAQRRRALGSLEGLSPTLRAAFDPAGFEPIRPPGPRDWLSQRDEPGQTWDQFRDRSGTSEVRILVLQPLDPLGIDGGPELDQLADFARAFFPGLEIVIAEPLAVDALGLRRRTAPGFDHPQLHSVDILDHLRRHLADEPAGTRILAVTLWDLYPGDSHNYHFGSAAGPVGVFSFKRFDARLHGMDPPPPGWRTKWLELSAKVLAHEATHMLDVRHCIYYRCLMNGANNLPELDAKSPVLCPVDLRKLQHVLGFDPRDRYEGLQRVAKELELPMAAWLTGRIETLSTRAGVRED